MVAVFEVTGSIDIVLDRLVSLGFGVAVVVLVFLVCRRHWGTHVAVAAALIASLLPTSVMNDASGMLEPLGVALCLLGLIAWPRRGFWSGLAFGLASMARAEAWVFGIGMVVAAFFKRRGARRAQGALSIETQRIPLVAGFLGVMVVYVKILADKTGNPIYPLWWNFLANAAGQWEFAPVSAGQASVRPVLGLLLVLAAAGLAQAGTFQTDFSTDPGGTGNVNRPGIMTLLTNSQLTLIDLKDVYDEFGVFQPLVVLLHRCDHSEIVEIDRENGQQPVYRCHFCSS